MTRPVVISLLVLAACGSADEQGVDAAVDGAAADARSVDGAAVDGPDDAAVDSAAVDAAVDGVAVDAPTDAAIDAAAGGLTQVFAIERTDDELLGMAVAPDNKVVLTGRTLSRITPPVEWVARYLTGGGVDTTFAPPHPLVPMTQESRATAVAARPDGSITAAMFVNAQGLRSGTAWISASGAFVAPSDFALAADGIEPGMIEPTSTGVIAAHAGALWGLAGGSHPRGASGAGGQATAGTRGGTIDDVAAVNGGQQLVVLRGATVVRLDGLTGALDPSFGAGGVVTLPYAGPVHLAASPAGALAVVAEVATPAPHLEIVPVADDGTLGAAISTAFSSAAIDVARDGNRVVVLGAATPTVTTLTFAVAHLDTGVVDVWARDLLSPCGPNQPLPDYFTGCLTSPRMLRIAPSGMIVVGFEKQYSAPGHGAHLSAMVFGFSQ